MIVSWVDGVWLVDGGSLLELHAKAPPWAAQELRAARVQGKKKFLMNTACSKS